MKKNPWPTGLLAVFGLFLTVQFCFLGLCRANFEGLDDVEYYRHGIEYGQEIKRRERQAELGWTVEVQPIPLAVRVAGADGAPLQGAKVTVKLERPATIRDDRLLELREGEPGHYSASAVLEAGFWDLEVTVEHGGEVYRKTVEARA